MDATMATMLGYWLMGFHGFLGLVALVGPYLTNNVFYLILLMILNLTVLAQWGIFRRCVITGFENYMLGNDPMTDTVTAQPIHMVFGESTYIVYNLIPYINSLVICWKLYSLFFEDDPGQYVQTYALII
jgi:hypothetical protein